MDLVKEAAQFGQWMESDERLIQEDHGVELQSKLADALKDIQLIMVDAQKAAAQYGKDPEKKEKYDGVILSITKINNDLGDVMKRLEAELRKI